MFETWYVNGIFEQSYVVRNEPLKRGRQIKISQLSGKQFKPGMSRIDVRGTAVLNSKIDGRWA